jgi:hypothetical protein
MLTVVAAAARGLEAVARINFGSLRKPRMSGRTLCAVPLEAGDLGFALPY